MPNYERFALGALYAQYDDVARGRDKHGDSAALHAAILQRLAAHSRVAGAAGWTSLALERDGGMGRLRLVGLAPGASRRTAVPDAGPPALD
jgi:hypothetical protein